MIFLAVLLISLQSLYFYSLGLPLYSVVGVLLLFGFAIGRAYVQIGCGWKVPRKLVIQVSAPFVLLFLSLFTFVLRGEAEFSRLAGFIVISLLPISYALLSDKIDPVKIASNLVLIHAFIFSVQFILYFGFGVDFDPVNLLSDVEQRGWGGSLNHQTLGKFRRLGGIYAEPGTYATYVAPLVAMLCAVKAKGFRYQVAIYTGLVTLSLTFSIFAWVFVVVILGVMFLTSFRRVLLLAPAIPLIFSLAWPYIEYRFFDPTRNVDSGFSFREEILISIYEYHAQTFTNFFFGTGLLTDKVPFEFVGAVNDVGLLAYALLTSGALGLLTILVIVGSATWRHGFAGIALALILLLSKISIFAPMFWLILTMSAHASYLPKASSVSFPAKKNERRRKKIKIGRLKLGEI